MFAGPLPHSLRATALFSSVQLDSSHGNNSRERIAHPGFSNPVHDRHDLGRTRNVTRGAARQKITVIVVRGFFIGPPASGAAAMPPLRQSPGRSVG